MQLFKSAANPNPPFRTRHKNLPCAGVLECGGQIWNHHRVELRCGDYELQIIGFPVANRAWAPMLIVGCADEEQQIAKPSSNGYISSSFQDFPIHHRCWWVRINNLPLLATTDEFDDSPSGFVDTNSNSGLARKTKQSPPCVIV